MEFRHVLFRSPCSSARPRYLRFPRLCNGRTAPMSMAETARTSRSAEAPVLLRRDEAGVTWLTLNRPAQRNALSIELMAALQRELDAIAKEPATKVVVIAGAGPAFCAGHDLRELRTDPSRQFYERIFQGCSRLMSTVVALPKSVIARVHGIAT